MALARIYITPPAPQMDAAMVAAPVAGHFVPVDIGAALRPFAPPRGANGNRGTVYKKRSLRASRVCIVCGDENPYTIQHKRAKRVN